MEALQPVPDVPRPGQESVWDYPRPARLESCGSHLRVELDGVIVADTARGLRVVETSHPPTYYFPAPDCDAACFGQGWGRSFCEWKGRAEFWNVSAGGRVVENGAWSYPLPSGPFRGLRDHRAFYPQLFDCFVDGEAVVPQAGAFYGGWITSKVCGPFKGEPGTSWW